MNMNRHGVEKDQFGELFAEQVKLLFHNAPVAYATTLVNGAILVYVLRADISASVLLAWYGCLLVVTGIRVIAAWRYGRIKPSHRDVQRWNTVYVAGAALAGAVWGATAVVLFPLDSIAYQAFISFVLAGMAAGGVSVLAARREACLAFLLPLLLPLAIRFLGLDTDLQRAMGVLTLVFLVGMFVSSANFYCSILTSLNLRFDKRGLQQEIERRLHAEQALSSEKERLQTTLSAIGESVVLVNANGVIEYMNPATERTFGWPRQEVLHRPVNDVFKSVDLRDEPASTAMEDSLRTRSQITKQNVVFCKAEKKHLVEEIATPIYDHQGEIAGAVAVLHDVTEAQQKTEQLAYAADHDALTGLPNRNLLKDRTSQAIARAQRKREKFALLFLDLDRFKEVNDSMGHAAGDALLVDVAQRLTSCVREEDTIARLGGDEFVVLLDGPAKEGQVRAIADKIRNALRKPYRLGTKLANVTVSIGMSLYPNDGTDTESLLVHADTAMYRAKQHGRDLVWG